MLEFDTVMHEERLQRLLGRLLAVEARVIGDGRMCAQIGFSAPQIGGGAIKPLPDEFQLRLHTVLCPL